MSLLRSMTERINEQLDYRRRSERGVQTPSETLQNGYGTCRDFAVLMIEGETLPRPPRQPPRDRYFHSPQQPFRRQRLTVSG
jgi:hypothetical protein